MMRSTVLENTLTPVADNNETDLRDYITIISRYKWSIFGSSIILALLAVIVVFSMEPVYQATATLLIDAQKNQIVSIEEVYDVPDVNDEYFETQTQILQSRQLIKQVIEKNNLASHPEFNPATSSSGFSLAPANWLPEEWFSDNGPASEYDLENQLIDTFREKLSVSHIRDSQLIEISFDSNDPGLAASIPNSLANGYIENNIGSRIAMTQEAVGWISEDLEDLRQKVIESEKALQEYRDNENLVDVGGVDSIAANELDALTTSLIEAKRNMSETRALLNQVMALRGQPVAAYGSIPAVLSDPGVLAAREKQIQAQSKVSEFSERYGPMHPSMIAAQTELKETNQNVIRQINNVITSVSGQYDVARSRVEDLTNALAATKGDVADINRKQATLHALQREVDNNRELYEIFVTRLKETNVTSDMQSANARIIDPAAVPTMPVKPDKPLIISLTFLLGLAGSIFAAFMKEALDNTLKYSSDVEQKLHLPVLGILPKIPGKLIGGKLQSIRYYSTHLDSAFAENIRTVRTNMLLANMNEKKKLIVITSSIPGEGKSTVAVNLALSLAQMGKTLLIDMDLRRPIVAKIFKLKRRNAIGLSDFISGVQPLKKCVNHFDGEDLFVMPAGTVPSLPLEMVSSERFKQGLDALRNSFDYIVIDSPPVIPVSDAIILSGFANAVIYITKANDTPYQLAQDGIKQLKQVGAPIIGVILNQITFSEKPGSYGNYITDYYKAYGYSNS